MAGIGIGPFPPPPPACPPILLPTPRTPPAAPWPAFLTLPAPPVFGSAEPNPNKSSLLPEPPATLGALLGAPLPPPPPPPLPLLGNAAPNPNISSLLPPVACASLFPPPPPPPLLRDFDALPEPLCPPFPLLLFGFAPPPGDDLLSGTTLPLALRVLLTLLAVEAPLVAAEAGPGVGDALLPWLAGRALLAAGLFVALLPLLLFFDAPPPSPPPLGDLFEKLGLVSALMGFLLFVEGVNLEMSEE